MLAGQPSIWTVRWDKLPAVTWQMSSSEAEDINTCSMRQEHSPGHWRTLHGGAYRGWEVQPIGAGKVTAYLLGVLTVLHSHKTLLQARSKPLPRGRETEEDAGHPAWVTSGSLSFPFTVWLVSCLDFVQGWSWTLTTLLLPKCYLFLESVWSPVVIKGV